MRPNIRRIRDCVAWLTPPGLGLRRIPPMVFSLKRENETPPYRMQAIQTGAGEGSWFYHEPVPYCNIANGIDLQAPGVCMARGAGNRLSNSAGNDETNVTDFGTWNSTEVTVAESLYPDMYGEDKAQKLTPSAVDSNIRAVCDMGVDVIKSRPARFSVDLKADVAHTARLLIDNNQGTEKLVDVSVTRTWKRFHLQGSAFPALPANGQVLCCSIYPDIDSGSNHVYARLPYAVCYVPSAWTGVNVDAYGSHQVERHFAPDFVSLCGRTPSNAGIQQGTVIFLFAPLFDGAPLTTGSPAMQLFQIGNSYDTLLGDFSRCTLFINDTNLYAELVDLDYNMLVPTVALAELGLTRGTYCLIGITWNTEDIQLYLNGSLVASDDYLNESLPAPLNMPAAFTNQCYMGFSNDGHYPIMGVVRMLCYEHKKTDVAWHLKKYNDLKRSGEIA